MSLGQTLLRSIERLTSAPYEANGAEDAGAQGEAMIAAVLDTIDGARAIANPLVPHPRHPGGWLESDFLVYAYGKLFCLEVKNYSGTIAYPPGSWSEPNAAPHIVQVKRGRYGAPLDVKQHPNPLRKTNGFVYDLKRYLGGRDPRFARLYITSVVVFGPGAEVSSIRNPAAGLIGIAELAGYLRSYGQPLHGPTTPRLIAEMFAHVPSWDWVRTSRGAWHYGVLAPPGLRYTNARGVPICIPWRELGAVSRHPGGLFDGLFGDDRLTLRMRDGRRLDDRCRRGGVVLRRGSQQLPFDLHHLGEIEVRVSGMTLA